MNNPIQNNRIVNDETFAIRLKSFIKEVKVCYPMSEEEQEYLLEVAGRLLDYQVETATDNDEIDYLKRIGSMERKDIIQSPEYWAGRIKIELFRCAKACMEENSIGTKSLRNRLGISKQKCKNLLNCDFNGNLDSFCKIALKSGFVPKIEFVPIDEYLKSEGLP